MFHPVVSQELMMGGVTLFLHKRRPRRRRRRPQTRARRATRIAATTRAGMRSRP
uniref:Uncharacterized protein n=1 Tax=Arundo donax TaxID=35708 RepID=A0A0A9F9L0_ARUDO